MSFDDFNDEYFNLRNIRNLSEQELRNYCDYNKKIIQKTVDYKIEPVLYEKDFSLCYDYYYLTVTQEYKDIGYELPIIDTSYIYSSSLTFETYIRLPVEIKENSNIGISIVNFSVFNLTIYGNYIQLEYSNDNKSYTSHPSSKVLEINKWIQVGFSLNKKTTDKALLSWFIEDDFKSETVLLYSSWLSENSYNTILLNRNELSVNHYDIQYSYMRLWKSYLSPESLKAFRGISSMNISNDKLFFYYDFKYFMYDNESGSNSYFDSTYGLSDDNYENTTIISNNISNILVKYNNINLFDNFPLYKFDSSNPIDYDYCGKKNTIFNTDNQLYDKCRVKNSSSLVIKANNSISLLPPTDSNYLEISSFTIDTWLKLDIKSISSIQSNFSSNIIANIISSISYNDDRVGIYISTIYKSENNKLYLFIQAKYLTITIATTELEISNKDWYYVSLSLDIKNKTKTHLLNDKMTIESIVNSLSFINISGFIIMDNSSNNNANNDTLSKIFDKVYLKSFRYFNEAFSPQYLYDIKYLHLDKANTSIYNFYFDDSHWEKDLDTSTDTTNSTSKRESSEYVMKFYNNINTNNYISDNIFDGYRAFKLYKKGDNSVFKHKPQRIPLKHVINNINNKFNNDNNIQLEYEFIGSQNDNISNDETFYPEELIDDYLYSNYSEINNPYFNNDFKVRSLFCDIHEEVYFDSVNKTKTCFNDNSRTEIFATKLYNAEFKFISTQSMTIEFWFLPYKKLDGILFTIHINDDTKTLLYELSTLNKSSFKFSGKNFSYTINMNINYQTLFSLYPKYFENSKRAKAELSNSKWNYLSIRINYNNNISFAINNIVYPDSSSKIDISNSDSTYPFYKSLSYIEEIKETEKLIIFKANDVYYRNIKIYNSAMDLNKLNSSKYSSAITGYDSGSKPYNVLFLPLKGISYPVIRDYSSYDNSYYFNNGNNREFSSGYSHSSSSFIISTLVTRIKYNDNALVICDFNSQLDLNSNSCYPPKLLNYILSPNILINRGELFLPINKFGLNMTSTTWYLMFWVKTNFKVNFESDFIIFGQYLNTNNDFCLSKSSSRGFSYNRYITENNSASTNVSSTPSQTALYIKYKVATKEIQVIYQFSDLENNNSIIKEYILFSMIYDLSEIMNHIIVSFKDNSLSVFINLNEINDRSYYNSLEIEKNDIYLSIIPSFNNYCKYLLGYQLNFIPISKYITNNVIYFINSIGISTMPFDRKYLPFIFKNRVSRESSFLTNFTIFNDQELSDYYSLLELKYSNPDDSLYYPINKKYITESILRSSDENPYINESLCPALAINNSQFNYSKYCDAYNVLKLKLSHSGLNLNINNSIENSFTLDFSIKLNSKEANTTINKAFILILGNYNIDSCSSENNEFYVLVEHLIYNHKDSISFTFKNIYSSVFKTVYDTWLIFSIRTTVLSFNNIRATISMYNWKTDRTIYSSFNLPYLTISNKLVLSIANNNQTEINSYIYFQYIRIFNNDLSDGEIYLLRNSFIPFFKNPELNTYYDFRFYYNSINNEFYEYVENISHSLSNYNTKENIAVFEIDDKIVVCGDRSILATNIVDQQAIQSCKEKRTLLFLSHTTYIPLIYPTELTNLTIKEFTVEIWFSIDCSFNMYNKTSIMYNGISGSSSSNQIDLFITKDKKIIISLTNNDSIQHIFNHSDSEIKFKNWNFYSFSISNSGRQAFSLLNNLNKISSVSLYDNYLDDLLLYYEISKTNNSFLNLGVSNNSCSKMYLRSFRFWNKARTLNQIIETQYLILNGKYYQYLIYNFDFYSEGDYLVNNVKQLISENNYSNSDIELSKNSLSYYMIQISKLNEFKPSWANPTTATSLEDNLELCFEYQSKNAINETVTGGIKNSTYLSNLVKCRSHELQYYILGTHINKLSYLFNNGINWNTRQLQFEFWGYNEIIDIHSTNNQSLNYLFSVTRLQDNNKIDTNLYSYSIDSKGLYVKILDIDYELLFKNSTSNISIWMFYSISIDLNRKKIVLKYGDASIPSISQNIIITNENIILLSNDISNKDQIFLNFNNKGSQIPFYFNNFKVFNINRSSSISLAESQNTAQTLLKKIEKYSSIIETDFDSLILYLPLRYNGIALDNSSYGNVITSKEINSKAYSRINSNKYYILNDISDEYLNPGIYQGLIKSKTSSNRNLFICEGDMQFNNNKCVVSDIKNNASIIPNNLNYPTLSFLKEPESSEYYYISTWFKLPCSSCSMVENINVAFLEHPCTNFLISIKTFTKIQFNNNTNVNIPFNQWIQIFLIKNNEFVYTYKTYNDQTTTDNRTLIPELKSHSFNKKCLLSTGRSLKESRKYQRKYSYSIRNFLLGKGKMPDYFSTYLFNNKIPYKSLDLLYYYVFDEYKIVNENIYIYNTATLEYDKIIEDEYSAFLVFENEKQYRDSSFDADLSYCENNKIISIINDSDNNYYNRRCISFNYYKIPTNSSYLLNTDYFKNLVSVLPFTLEFTFIISSFTSSEIGVLDYYNSNINIRIWISYSTINIQLNKYDYENILLIGSEVINISLVKNILYENTVFIIAEYYNYGKFRFGVKLNDKDFIYFNNLNKSEYNKSISYSSINLSYSGIDNNNYIGFQSLRLWAKNLNSNEIKFYEKKILINLISKTTVSDVLYFYDNQNKLTNKNILFFYLDFRVFLSLDKEVLYEGISNLPLLELPKNITNNTSYSVDSFISNFEINLKIECGGIMYYSKSENNTLICDSLDLQDLHDNTCESGHYLDYTLDSENRYIHSCKACSSGCEECFLSAFNCDTCSNFRHNVEYQIGKCGRYKDTIPHFYLDYTFSPYYWKECHSSCLNCSGKERNNCIDCMPNAFLTYNNTCSNECEYGQYKDENGECINCFTQCKSCVSKPDFCLECSDDTFFIAKNECGDTCHNNYYAKNKSCLPCDSSCYTCEENDKFCLICNEDYYPLEDNPNMCENSSPIGYYFNYSTYIYSKCDSSCLTCENKPTFCTSCTNYQFKNTCDDNCPIGYYKGIDNSKKKCFPCNENCYECNDAGDICISCSKGLILQSSGKCSKNCEDGFIMLDNQCEPCAPPCKLCNGNVNYCESCIDEFLYMESTHTCISKCPITYYKDIDNCKKCNHPCYTCSFLNICETCDPKYYLYNGQCMEKCPSKTFSSKKSNSLDIAYNIADKIGGFCYDCYSNCSTCTNKYLCTICDKDFYLIDVENISNTAKTQISIVDKYNSEEILGKICVSKCPDTFYLKDKQCLKCSENCFNCVNTSDKCTSCKGHQVLISEINSCISNSMLEEGYFYSVKTNSLIKCHENCKTCLDENYNSCITCYENSVKNTLKHGECIEKCLSNEYKYIDSNGIEQCLDLKSCINKVNISCNETIDIEYVDTEKIKMYIYFTKTCLNIFKTASQESGYSDIGISSSIDDEISFSFLNDIYEFIISPDYASSSFSTDNFANTNILEWSYYPSFLTSGKYVIYSYIRNRYTGETIMETSKIIFAKLFKIIVELNNGGENTTVNKTDDDKNIKLEFIFKYGVSFYLSALESYDEKWEGAKSNEEISCEWICSDELNTICEENAILDANDLEKSSCELISNKYFHTEFIKIILLVIKS